MKYLRLFLIICFISYIKSEDDIYCSQLYYYDENGKKVELPHKSADDCKGRLSKYEKEEGKEYCCYVYGSKKKDKGYCESYDKYQYENIGKVIKTMKLENEIYEDAPDEDDEEDYYDYDGDPHIDCYSQYMKLSLIGFLLILF